MMFHVPCPPILQELPTHSKGTKAALSQFFNDIRLALSIPNLSLRDKDNIWKVFTFFGRFVALAPARNEVGEEVAQVHGFARRLHALLYQPGGASTLWADHLEVAALGAFGRVGHGQRDSTAFSDDHLKEVRNSEVQRCLDGGDVGKAYKALVSDATVVDLSPDQAYALLSSKYDMSGPPATDEVFHFGMELLERAKREGRLVEGELDPVVGIEAMFQSVKKATKFTRVMIRCYWISRGRRLLICLFA